MKTIHAFFIFGLMLALAACQYEPVLSTETEGLLDSTPEITLEPTLEPTPIVPTPTPIVPTPTPVDPAPNDPSDALIELTLAELSEFDGREGRKAYIAVAGYIYDVTNSPRWPNGNHNGYQAGQDLTYEILNISPHGTSVLNNIPLIGILVDDPNDE
jgi:predicted heme/steroid binding protein